MTTSRRSIMLVVALLFVLILPSIALAQEDNRAGLVVLHGDGSTTTQCVSFSEAEITGLQLLERSSLDLNYDPSSGMGVAVCRIDGEGCSFPQDSCFCQCEGNPCNFWSYWYLDTAGEWIYSPLGSANHTLGNGDVDAWVWNAGASPSSQTVELTPPDIAFADICPQATATPVPESPLPTPIAPPTPDGPPESPLPVPGATAVITPNPTPVPASEPVTIPEPITLVLFGSGLAGLGFQAWRKRKDENR